MKFKPSEAQIMLFDMMSVVPREFFEHEEYAMATSSVPKGAPCCGDSIA